LGSAGWITLLWWILLDSPDFAEKRRSILVDARVQLPDSAANLLASENIPPEHKQPSVARLLRFSSVRQIPTLAFYLLSITRVSPGIWCCD
jgi:hypothetical protein